MTQTIIVRIDTLDRHTLSPCLVGYCALKLCCDDKGLQPKNRKSSSSSIYLNAGRFKLPIVLGLIPSWCSLTEESIEDMPLLPGGFLIVRLFDAAVEVPSKISKFHKFVNANENMLKAVDSCAEVLYTSSSDPAVMSMLEGRNVPLVPHLKERAGKALIHGEPLNKLDFQQMSTAILNWVKSAMPPQDKMVNIMDYRYMMFYDDSKGGISVSADMLYNMPERSLMSPKGYVTGYKVMFQYLRADSNPWKDEYEGEDPYYIIDDASKNCDMDASTESCYIFRDNPDEAKCVYDFI